MFREFVVAKLCREDARRRDLALAWHVEALARQKTLPPLIRLLAPVRPTQTRSELRAMLHVLSEQYGIPLQKGAARG